MVYSALDQEFAFPILNAFERSTDHQTGVIAKFDVESTKTVGLVNLIIAEEEVPDLRSVLEQRDHAHACDCRNSVCCSRDRGTSSLGIRPI